MPVATIAEGRDLILDHFKTAWDAGTPPIPLVLYDDRKLDLPPDDTYARVTVQHNVFEQRTLGGKPSLGGSGRRFRRSGIIAIQIFTINDAGLTTSDALVDLIVDAFEGEDTSSDEVEFINVRANEVGHDGAWHQTNVLAEFRYDRVK